MKEFSTFLSFPTANPHPISTATVTPLPLISSLLSAVVRITTESHGYYPIAPSLRPDRIKLTPQKDSWGLHSLAPTLAPNFISSCASSPAFRHTDPNILQTANPLGILEAPPQWIPLPLSSNSDHLNTSRAPPLERFCNNWWGVCVHHFTGTWASQEPRSCLSMSLSSPCLSHRLPHRRWSLSVYQMNTKETGTCAWGKGTSPLGFLLPLPGVPYPGTRCAEQDTSTAIRHIPKARAPDHTTPARSCLPARALLWPWKALGNLPKRGLCQLLTKHSFLTQNWQWLLRRAALGWPRTRWDNPCKETRTKSGVPEETLLFISPSIILLLREFWKQEFAIFSNDDLMKDNSKIEVLREKGSRDRILPGTRRSFCKQPYFVSWNTPTACWTSSNTPCPPYNALSAHLVGLA